MWDDLRLSLFVLAAPFLAVGMVERLVLTGSIGIVILVAIPFAARVARDETPAQDDEPRALAQV